LEIEEPFVKNLLYIVFTGLSLILQTTTTQAETFQYQRSIYRPTGSKGFGISLADFGGNLLIGDVYGDIYQPNSGNAFLYDVSTGQKIRQFVNPSFQPGDLFGREVGVVGNNVLVGAPGGTYSPGGTVYIFNGQTGQFLRSVSNPAGAVNDRFGYALGAIGNNIIVGTPELRTGTEYNGSGRVYLMNGTSGAVVRTINNPELNPGPYNEDSFGYDVASYGNNVIVGALYDEDGGKVWQINSQDGSITRRFDNPDGSLGSGNLPQFGASVDVLGDYLLVGANQSSANGILGSGAAYLFDLTTGDLLHRFFDPVPHTLDNFGISVELVDGYAIVGAHNDNDGGKNGSVFVFDVDSGDLVQTIKSPLATSDFFGGEISRVGNNMLAVGDEKYSGVIHIYSVPEPGSLILCLSGIALVLSWLGARWKHRFDQGQSSRNCL
jgi:hypothetical protein